MASLKNILKSKQQAEEDILRCGSMRAVGEGLAPLMEGPTPESFDAVNKRVGKWGSLQWLKGQLLTKTPSMARAMSMSHRFDPQAETYKESDVRLLLGVLGALLAPVAVSETKLPFLSIKSMPLEASSAQYIIQQYMCATGVAKINNVRNSYAMGRVKMVASEFETASGVVKTRSSPKNTEPGFFVLWQMTPNMWNMEMAVGGSKVHAGSNGRLVWRQTPWLGSHAAKGPVRPLRRALQGLDPRTVASVFWRARCIGEKRVRGGEDCFILKLAADPDTLAARSEGPAEIIRHVLFGYFSQKTGLLVHVEDSHLTRIQSTPGGDALFWETNIDSSIDDYRDVDGVMIAHSGKSTVTLFRFGEVAMSHTKTRLEEEWAIDEVAFDVAGLSAELFIPPADICAAAGSESVELSSEDRGKCLVSSVGSSRNKVAAVDESCNIIWRVEV